MKKNSLDIIKLTAKLMLIIAVMLVIIFNYEKLTSIDIRAVAENSSSIYVAALSIIGIYIIKGFVFVIPASLIYISVGMAFSPAVAVAVNLIGIAAEVTVSYLFGLFVGGEYVNSVLSKSKGGNKLLELNNQDKKSSVLAIRALPVFPIDFTSLFFGSMKMPFPKYLILSVIGIAPRVILFTVLGDTIYDYIPMSLIIKIIIAAIAAAAIVLIVKWFISGKKNKN